METIFTITIIQEILIYFHAWPEASTLGRLRTYSFVQAELFPDRSQQPKKSPIGKWHGVGATLENGVHKSHKCHVKKTQVTPKPLSITPINSSKRDGNTANARLPLKPGNMTLEAFCYHFSFLMSQDDQGETLLILHCFMETVHNFQTLFRWCKCIHSI